MIKAGVIGWPVKHSLSPQLHGWWLKQYGIAGEYQSYPVEPGTLREFIGSLKNNGFKGVNVTVPHKQEVLQYLDRLTPVAQGIGAVNTVVVEVDGTLLGDNTDAYGFITSLKAEAPGFNPALPAIVLGAGGAARAIVASLQNAGVRNLILINRTREHAQELAHSLGVTAYIAGWNDLPTLLPQAGLLVNTTVLGMAGQPPLEIDPAGLGKGAVVFDLIYNPLETPLLRAARIQGNTALNGLGMLLHQAVPGFEYWFGKRPEVMLEQRRSLEALLK